jgi:hypothetical protein
MDVTHEPSKSFAIAPPTKHWRKQRRRLGGFVVCLILLGLFYAEENWRGKRAWENCKRALVAQGIELNWAKYIPAPVPDDENVFAVPEMHSWFARGVGAGWKGLAKNLSSPTYPGVNIDSNTPRMLVAEVTIGLPGVSASEGSVPLRWDDAASRAEAARLLTNVLGPTAAAPQSLIGLGFMLRAPEGVQPARIFLQCQAAPTEKDLQEFLPDALLRANSGLPDRVLNFEPNGNGSYRVTMPVLAKAADFLAWSEQLEPQLALIRQALQRPSARLPSYYGNPKTLPIANFSSVRTLMQTLAARAECRFLLGQPEEALRDLTLMHDFCRRILEESKPMTLIAAMMDVAIKGLYATTMAEGLRLQAWREPQLAALEEQLKTINLLQPMRQALELEAEATFHTLENAPSAGLVRRWALSGLFPRGWGYQHMVTRVHLDLDWLASLDSASRNIFPDKVEAASEKAHALDDWSPYTFVAYLAPPNLAKASQTTAHSQTEINQALIACALEHYHLARGAYPENLRALIPQFLDEIPHDVIGGQPPHYRRAVDGMYVLYSIGWNGLDKGGARGQSLQSAEGDWVWPD